MGRDEVMRVVDAHRFRYKKALRLRATHSAKLIQPTLRFDTLSRGLHAQRLGQLEDGLYDSHCTFINLWRVQRGDERAIDFQLVQRKLTQVGH